MEILNADVIHAYADGKTVQFLHTCAAGSAWLDYKGEQALMCVGHTSVLWRVKPVGIAAWSK